MKIQRVLWSANCYNRQYGNVGKEEAKEGIWKIFRLCSVEISKRNLAHEDSDWCSMWSAQLPDTAASQAWGTAGVTGSLAKWDQPLLDFLLAFSWLLTIEVSCIKVMSLAGPDKFVSVGVH